MAIDHAADIQNRDGAKLDWKKSRKHSPDYGSFGLILVMPVNWLIEPKRVVAGYWK